MAPTADTFGYGLVTPIIDDGVGTNRERWVGWVAPAAYGTAQYGDRVMVTDRVWYDVDGAEHPLPAAEVHVSCLRRIGR